MFHAIAFSHMLLLPPFYILLPMMAPQTLSVCFAIASSVPVSKDRCFETTTPFPPETACPSNSGVFYRFGGELQSGKPRKKNVKIPYEFVESTPERMFL
jgi:hypothetical protein